MFQSHLRLATESQSVAKVVGKPPSWRFVRRIAQKVALIATCAGALRKHELFDCISIAYYFDGTSLPFVCVCVYACVCVHVCVCVYCVLCVCVHVCVCVCACLCVCMFVYLYVCVV